ncbi:MAG: DUF4097 domain-containing protein [Gemmatimonadaceae bacterium]|nr:DUF4097 domain-containing protein [Gemmatimonadaceae bacterium]
MRRTLLPALALLALPLAAQERYTLPTTTSIYDLVGSVKVESHSGSGIVVEVTRTGPDASKLRVEQGEIDGRHTFRVVFPSTSIRYADRGTRWRGRWNTTMSVRSDGTFGGGWESGVRGRRVRISSDGDFDAAANLRVLVPAGAKLWLNHGVGDVSTSGTNATLSIDLAAAEATVRNHTGSLSVDAGSGRLDVSGVKGSVNLDTGSGEVVIAGVEGERIMLDAGSGGVEGSNLSATTLSIDAGSGEVRLRGVRAARTKLDAGSGGVRLGFVNSPEDVTVDAGSGSVDLAFPESLDASIDIETGSGGIVSEFAVTTERMSRDRLVGKVGKGTGRIRVDAGSGSVRLLKRG